MKVIITVDSVQSRLVEPTKLEQRYSKIGKFARLNIILRG